MRKFVFLFGGLGTSLISAKLGYVYGTGFEKEIKVKRTFNRIKSGSTENEYMISDYHHNLYKVESSFWYWQWYPTELWTSFQPNQKYKIYGYGIRIKAFGIHPIIVRSEEIDE